MLTPLARRGFLLAGIRIFGIDSFYFPFVKIINLFAGALVATTAANVLLASDTYAFPPNGWTQVGKGCDSKTFDEMGDPIDYYKLRKDSNQSMYGVYKSGDSGDSWDKKDITLAEANARINSINGCSGY